MATRQEIADAMNTVVGVSVSPHYRQTLAPGDGMVRLERVAPSDNRFGRMVTWQVWIVLDQDVERAERWVESYAPALVDAFETVCAFTSLTPTEIALGGQVANGIVIEGAAAEQFTGTFTSINP